MTEAVLRSTGRVIALAVCLLAGDAARASAQQQSVSDVLSFLLTNRTIVTDEFERDEQATMATSDAITAFLLSELSTFALSTSAGGFTYRLDRSLGTVVLSSDSFGPFFTERSLTVGEGHVSFGLGYERATFDRLDGRDLRDGTMVAMASRLRGESEPFDVETLSLHLRTETITLTSNFGVTDRLDISGAVPLVRLSMNGQRFDAYRGRQSLQATATATASGIGDVVIRAKYNVLRAEASGLAVGGDVRLPSGSEENLLGSGEVTIRPRLIGTLERGRFAMHGTAGYAFGNLPHELDYGGAVTYVSAQRLTLVGEIIGQRRSEFVRLLETIEPHPSLRGVDTIRLTGVAQETNRLVGVAGFKWNLGSTWLVSANLRFPLTDAGLNARWIPTLMFDYSFGQ